MKGDAGALAGALAGRIVGLVAELLPQGHREGQEWRCGSVAGEPGASLGVHLSGRRAGVWADFASGEAGDALDLVAAVRFHGDRRPAMVWARQWLGLPDAPPPPAAQARDGGPQQAEGTSPAADAQARQRSAMRIFLAAAPRLTGTPAALYLAGRGIDLAELGRQPRSLRYAAQLWNRESDRTWPALVAAVSDGAGVHVATHRTWLHEAARGRWTKAPLRAPKMTLGRLAGGSVRIWRGASGKPLAQAQDGEAVAIAEGLETALSVAIACPELRVLCAISLANMASVALPPAVRTVILCADNDGDNAAAARGLARAVAHFAGAGREVRLARSPIGKDFNDALRAELPA